MLFFTKKVWISKHAIQRYRERVPKAKEINDFNIRKAILKDLQIKNVRRKTVKNENNEFKVWVRGAKCYICVETQKVITIKTVINATPEREKILMEL